MNPATQCIILLVCVAICTSAPILKCRCINTSKVKAALIIEVEEYKPRPYCNKHEVIVTLRDKSSRCLDPDSKFTKQILQRKAMNKAKMTSRSTTTTVAPTTSAATTSS